MASFTMPQLCSAKALRTLDSILTSDFCCAVRSWEDHNIMRNVPTCLGLESSVLFCNVLQLTDRWPRYSSVVSREVSNMRFVILIVGLDDPEGFQIHFAVPRLVAALLHPRDTVNAS